MERQHIKSYNVDRKGKNRFRFESTKQRSKKVSADVYRSYKRRFDVTSAADREESVHRPKRRKAVVAENESDEDEEVYASTFAEELDMANERNGSELFGEFYREIWPLVRSVPELLHHSALVVDLLLAYLLSPESTPHEKTTTMTTIAGQESNADSLDTRRTYVMNHATTDVLHLLSVLAKDMQQEIHPYVYDKIMPRIIMDLLNPPPPPHDSGRQAIPLDVTIVEAAFRTLSYVFQHDTEKIVTESSKEGEEPCMEHMRRFYGPTLGHRRDVVRRLAAETFASLLRKLKSDEARKRHLKRVFRALTKSAATGGAALNRAKADAIDGVSTLLFETAKGVTGRLHSKGSLIIRCAFDYIAGLGEDFNDAMAALASTLTRKLFRHVSGGSEPKFDAVLDELRRFISRTLEKTQKAAKPMIGSALECSVCLLQDAVEFRDGFFFSAEKDNEVDFETEVRLKACIKVVSDLTDEPAFTGMSLSLSTVVVKLFFSIWNTASELSLPTSFFMERLKQILHSDENGTLRAKIVVRSYLEACTEMNSVRQAFSPIVSAVADIFDSDIDHAQTLLFRVLSKVPASEDAVLLENDVFPSVSEDSSFSCDNETCVKLLGCCAAGKVHPKDVAKLAHLGYSARCIPSLFSMADADSEYAAEKRTLNWMIQNIKILVDVGKDEGSVHDRLVPVALLIESFARVVSYIHERCEAAWFKKVVARCASLAWKLVLMCPESLWVTKSVAALCGVLPFFGIAVCDDANVAFHILVPNLRTDCHFLRLHTLQILDTFPRRPYVTNHGDLDLTDDLDEEPGFVGIAERNQSGLSGCSDLIGTLLKIESTTASFESERALAGLLTRVEVLGKSGRLPIAYAEALANHMLGVFHIKFSSLWKAVSRVLCGLEQAHHTILSEATCFHLEELLLPYMSNPPKDEVIDTNADPILHHRLCVEWDSSGGRNATLFQAQIHLAQEDGRVSPFLSTDRETVLREVMRVLEAVPEITAKYSRRIVPMFFSFLKHQYYCFHDNDPDAREIKIEKEVEGISEWKKTMMNRKTLQNRLLSFLRVFAAVKGSQQLIQRSLLLSIFNVNLSHQDAVVADAALTCIVNFSLTHISQYAEQLKKILKKGELRNALLDFPLSKDSDTIHPDHRQELLPVVERVLFGRLSASSFRGTNSKDSPLARRKAIVSSLAQLDSDELFPTVYLMIRNYTPNSFELKWEDVVLSNYERDVLNATGSFTTSDFNHIPIQRHEGFLNLLSALVSQLGHRLDEFVPAFMNILLGVMQCTAIINTEDGVVSNEESDTLDTDHLAAGPSPRLRAVRTLSFGCAAVIMDKFADVVDFTPYSNGLWEGISTSVTSLPSIVAKSGSTPSVLSLLLVLSSHDSLRPILSANRAVVEKVIMCIGPTSEDKALDIALEFILNLMNDAASCDELISNQVLLILRQFQGRFSGVVDEESTNNTVGKGMKASKALSKELMVLRKIGDLMIDATSSDETNTENSVQSELFNTLSSLLVKFLGHPRSYERDQLNVLGIVRALLPKIDTSTALSHFFRLSKLLNFDHWNRLATSTRREIITTMRAVSLCSGMNESIDRISKLLQEMFAMHPKRVEEMDYDRVLPALSGLCNSDHQNSWVSLLDCTIVDQKHVDRSSEPKFLTPVVFACFSLLQQDDPVVSRSAFKAIRALATAASLEDQRLKSGSSQTPWSIFIETSVVPGARSALRSSNEQVRRHAVSLIAEVSKNFAQSTSPNLHGDLSILACEENADLDFFVNILHVQSHRRCRALQRLRSRLNELSTEGGGNKISSHSLSNVILPLVIYPIYESKSNLEEALTQESIATVGALGRHFSWSKYHSVLWTALNQFSRHPEQEKLIIGMICALLDSFHFDLTSSDSDECRESAVWRALEKRVIPKIESLLVKEKRDRRGRTSKKIRPNVVLALLKLLKKFPQAYFEKNLPRLLAIVCNSLKNRESNIRDLARKAMAAITVELGTDGLSEVIRCLAVTLTEGYQLHVRSATIHSILLKLSDLYSPLQDTTDNLPEFDKCIPAMMDLILQDMFGVASERREDGDTNRSLIKEAAGSKYLESVEIICRLLYFQPSTVRRSSIHIVVTPFFEKLKSDGIESKSIEKIKRCLRCVVSGLSRNESARTDEMFDFIYSTISPILTSSSERRGELNDAPTKLRPVVVWQPTSISAAKNAKDAVANKFLDQTKLATVIDGASAPRLTGTGRHVQMKHSNRLNSPANACATEFGLNMLLTTVKNSKKTANSSDLEAKLTPFLNLLTTCVCDSRENAVTLLSIRCIALLLKKGIRPAPEVFTPLGAKIIDILSTGEAVVGINLDLTQVCMVALTTLLKLQAPEAPSSSALRQEGTVQGTVLSLTEDQMTVLVSLLKESVATTEDSNASLGVIKALLVHRLMSPELYDLMEKLLHLSVRSHRESFRDQCCNIFITFLLDYPISTKRFEQHLRQVMLNIKYEHREGRMSAIRMVLSFVERVPLELIDTHIQLIFLPLVLQLVNDDSEGCRKAVSSCLERVVCRVSANVAVSLYDYVLRWYKGDNASLKRASLQLFGVFAEGRSEMLAQNDGSIMACLQSSLESTDSDWEQHYFSLVSLEKVIKKSASKLDDHHELWSAVLSELSHEHLWVKMTASRIIGQQLEQIQPTAIDKESGSNSFLVVRKGCLYDLATHFCGHLDAEESDMSTELSELAIKSLTWIALAMNSSPELCYADGEGEGKQPVKWLLSRLSGTARRKGTKRRQAVFKYFAALLHSGGTEMVVPYLHLIIEPLYRAMLEAAGTKNMFGNEKFSSESDLAKEVLGMFEESCGDEFLTTLASVKVQARERRDKRKDKLAAEVITDPAAAATKKIHKQVREKHRRKRRVEEHRNDRGARAKKRAF